MQVDKARFDAANARIFGVNDNSVEAHQSYCTKKGFQFPILADQGRAVAKAYGAAGKLANKRTVVVIGPDGKIRYHQAGMPTDDEILEALQ